MPLTLQQLNAATHEEALTLLDGLYEHSPWIAQAALKNRPFKSINHLKFALAEVVSQATKEQQLSLIKAHPELAGKAMVSQSLTVESSNEQNKAGLTNCSADEFARLQQLNASYNAKFGWPFILAVRGPRGLGLSRAEIIATFERRLHGHPDFELQECLRNIHRIAELRLNDKFGITPVLCNDVWDWHEALSQHSEAPDQLTVTYLTEAHRACAARLQGWMQDCGFDTVHIDAVGNVVGRFEAHQTTTEYYSNDSYSRILNKGYGPKKHINTQTLLTGSHYDTVRNGGKYDGRLGIFVPMACVRELHRAGQRLPFAIEVVAFAEEEGQRFKATFLGSGALTGDFKPEWLDQLDVDGVSMRAAIQHAGLCVDDIARLKRDPAQYLGFVEVHIEQGPVLNALNLPLGVVTSINASVRYTADVLGTACHAGTTPMNQRADAACAVAEFMLACEARAAKDGDSVATVGQLSVPNGSINVVPGRCQFSLDLRAPSNAQRDALEADVLRALADICTRRKVSFEITESMRASAAPSAPVWQQRWETAVASLGLPLHRMPSGAGHDAMKLHEVMPQAMLFVRGQNAGISHNPLESTTSDDMQLAVEAFNHLLEQLASAGPAAASQAD
ncbi:MAG: 2-oxo-4-hydroxy-4-carboxy-5-ureidoimidazoline decarboxylase [Rhodoferax sp.]|uniref:2-oxo-4-hydroxy-4-carboxy-5-ureidoimidazoline decarboxylase n=1 Tax=Rhodoferax sp. TaxID=50421 RepID=UPI0026221490|nr:2-oxo-4-hydroxy-4-carboxy-5-ureidoimidazoline decarboxylase [Rhodoferax sp.]MDD2879399.1 2-oxo-4-hydroxy-4-carboxy-5-ureidoimidazoline decarboxylase [Rhodoferax sp.]